MSVVVVVVLLIVLGYSWDICPSLQQQQQQTTTANGANIWRPKKRKENIKAPLPKIRWVSMCEQNLRKECIANVSLSQCV